MSGFPSRLTDLETAYGTYVASSGWRGPSAPRRHLYASARRRCLRRSCLEASDPAVFALSDLDTQARLWRGRQRERDLVIDLQRVGQITTPRFDVVAQQERVEIQDRQGRLVISGYIDGRIAWENGQTAPIEIKAWSPYLTDRIETFDDLYQNPWTWSGAHQLLAYLYSKPEPAGVLVLDRPGLPKILGVTLEDHLEALEGFLADAATCRDHLEAGTLPPFIDDPTECRRCPAYGTVCQPDIPAGEVRVLTDPALEARLERWHELKEAGKEWQSLDMDLKEYLRGVEHGIAGPFAITGRWQRGSKLELPPDIRRQYTQTDQKGRFYLTIEKVVLNGTPNEGK